MNRRNNKTKGKNRGEHNIFGRRPSQYIIDYLKKETELTTNERSLRSGRHQKPEMTHFLQSVKRGRGRPKKHVFIGTRSHTRGRVSQEEAVFRGDAINGNVTEQNGDIKVTLDNETPPLLSRQTTDVPETHDVRTLFLNLNERNRSPTVPPINEMKNRGQTCSRYLKECGVLTEMIENSGLETLNLVTVLKYALIKCNLGDTQLSFNAIKSASEDMAVGISWDIENQRKTQPRRSTQNNGNTRTNWDGFMYTPQPFD